MTCQRTFDVVFPIKWHTKNIWCSFLLFYSDIPTNIWCKENSIYTKKVYFLKRPILESKSTISIQENIAEIMNSKRWWACLGKSYWYHKVKVWAFSPRLRRLFYKSYAPEIKLRNSGECLCSFFFIDEHNYIIATLRLFALKCCSNE